MAYLALPPPRAWAVGVVPLSPALPSLRAGFLPQVKVSYFESQQAAALAHSVLYLTAVGESCSCLAVETVAIGCGKGGRKLWSLGGWEASATCLSPPLASWEYQTSPGPQRPSHAQGQ